MCNRGSPPESNVGRQHNSGGLWIGIVLVMIGLVLLLQTLRILVLDNWWALFILIPAAGALAGAWSNFRRQRRLTRSVSDSFHSTAKAPGAPRGRTRENGLNFGDLGVMAVCSYPGGLMILVVAGIFLFRLDWGKVWPVFIVWVGLIILIGAIAQSG